MTADGGDEMAWDETLDGLIPAFALDACDDDELAATGDDVARSAALTEEADSLREVAGMLAMAAAAPAPQELEARVLAEALRRRPAGRSVWAEAMESVDEVTAFVGQVTELQRLLGDLPPAAWQTTTGMGWTVQEVVAHLVAVEDYLGSFVGVSDFVPPATAEADHRAMTLPTVERHRAMSPDATVGEWNDNLGRVVGALRQLDPDDLDRRVAFTGLPMRLRSVLVARTFELWTHTDDIRRATGRPLVTPPPERLALMSALAVRSLPLGLAAVGRPRAGRTARVVLTGPGGGTWVQALGLGEGPGATDVLVVADVVDFCRLAAQRCDPADLDVHIEGDDELGGDLLAGAGAFSA